MQAPFSPDTVFRQSNRISSGSTIRKDGSLHRKSGSHRWQSAVADRYSQPARRYSCFGRVVQLDRADGTNSPLFTLFSCHKINLQTGKSILHQFEGLHKLWDTPFYTLAGPEIAVATTKAYSTRALKNFHFFLSGSFSFRLFSILCLEKSQKSYGLLLSQLL